MRKTILITGSTDATGLEAARMLVAQGHHVLLHGRNRSELKDTETARAVVAVVEAFELALAR